MKKLTLIAIALVAMATTFTSCKKDTTNDAAISLAGDTGYTATDATVNPGATFKVKWTATCTTTNMAFISITQDGTALAAWDKVEIPSASKSTYVAEASITAPHNAGAYTYAIIIYDKDNNELTSKSIVITVGGTVTLTSYTGKVLGDQFNSSLGSLFASSSGTVYLGSAMNATIGPTIDITYGLTGAGYTIPQVISGSERVAQGFTQPSAANSPSVTDYMSSTLDITTVTNAQLTALDFGSASTIITVASGSTYAFKNAAGKIGLFKVTALTPGSSTVTNGSITIDVKVQP